MLSMLEKVAIAYSFATLFVIELCYQMIKVIISGTAYSFRSLKNTLSDSFFNLIADSIMLLIDFLQALLESFSIAWTKAFTTANDFKHTIPK